MKFFKSFKNAVLLVAVLNLLYFFIEFIAALNIRSVSLLADSIDFIEDASINFLILFATSLAIINKARISILLSFIMLLPGLTSLWTVWGQINYQKPPEPFELSLVAFGALIINCLCTFILIKYRNQSGSLTRAAFLSARNDVYANLAIIFTGIITYIYPSIWPDIFVGMVIAYIRVESALEIYKKAYVELEQVNKSLKAIDIKERFKLSFTKIYFLNKAKALSKINSALSISPFFNFCSPSILRLEILAKFLY